MLLLWIVLFLIGILFYFKYNKLKQNIDIGRTITERTLVNEELNRTREKLIEQNSLEEERYLELLGKIDNALYQKALIEEKLRNQEMSFDAEVEEMRKAAIREHCLVLEDLAKDFTKSIAKSQNQLDEINKQYESMKTSLEIANQMILQKEADKNLVRFHQIQLTENELSDVIKLRELSQSFINKEILNKLVWKSYFEKHTNEMIARVVDKPTCGIYMLVDTLTDKIYIGQAVDIGARFKQHIKRGLGAEAAINNKLYPAMKNDGVENFCFYVLESCARIDLSQKEKEWIEFYKSNIYGLNGNAGG